MPRQGLFEGEDVLDMFDDNGDEDGDTNCPPSMFYSNRPRPYNIPSSNVPMPRHVEAFDTPTSLDPSINFVSLLQEQQAMLKNIMKQQEDMQKQQEQIIEKQKASEERIVELEDLLSEPAENSSKKKTRVTRQLTVS